MLILQHCSDEALFITHTDIRRVNMCTLPPFYDGTKTTCALLLGKSCTFYLSTPSELPFVSKFEKTIYLHTIIYFCGKPQLKTIGKICKFSAIILPMTLLPWWSVNERSNN